MDAILKIFKQLGADETFFYQLIIFVLLFIILKYLFFNKLQFVLDLREKKTTKLAEQADKKLQQADEFAHEYRQKLDKTYADIQNSALSQKNRIVEKEKDIYKEAELQVGQQIEQEKQKFYAEATKKKETLVQATDELAKELVGKFSLRN